MQGRGYASKIAAGMDEPFLASECVSCGACVQACPTATLIEKTVVDLGHRLLDQRRGRTRLHAGPRRKRTHWPETVRPCPRRSSRQSRAPAPSAQTSPAEPHTPQRSASTRCIAPNRAGNMGWNRRSATANGWRRRSHHARRAAQPRRQHPAVRSCHWRRRRAGPSSG